MRVISITPRGNLGQKRRAVNQSVKFGSISVKFLTVVIFSVLALFYLVQNQLSSVKRQDIKALQSQKTELVKQAEELQVNANTQKSMKSIQETAQKLNMIEAENVVYADSLTRNEIGQK